VGDGRGAEGRKGILEGTRPPAPQVSIHPPDRYYLRTGF
jgi:hypothetical protein